MLELLLWKMYEFLNGVCQGAAPHETLRNCVLMECCERVVMPWSFEY